jgi:hypothetical protein
MTQSRQMRALSILLAAAAFCPVGAQVPADEPVTVSAEHPRLFLRPQRLRLLRREKDRESMRWQQFAALVAGNAPMPERGFALSLYYQVSGDAAIGKQAVAWALAPGADLRQMALVYDWCQDVLTDAQKSDLARRLAQSMTASASDETIPSVRSRALAAIALFDEVPQTPQRELQRIVGTWWNNRMASELKVGRGVARDDAYALFELLHAVRDTTIVELRDCCRQFFKDFPIEHLMSYYPAVFDGPDTMYYIGAERKIVDPDLRLASLSRAAQLAMVAYDVNGAESQVIQGWLMHDKFILKSPYGAPYEFLWANPYLPGLSYFHVPLVFHNPENGHLFIRSSWDDSATWFGYWDGAMQLFQDGKLTAVDARPGAAPLSLEQAVVCFAKAGSKFRVKLGEDEDAIFVVGLEPRHAYLVEIDDEEMFEGTTDPGGILVLEAPKGKEVGFRFRPAAAATAAQ